MASRPSELERGPTELVSRPSELASNLSELASRLSELASRPSDLASGPCRPLARLIIWGSQPGRLLAVTNAPVGASLGDVACGRGEGRGALDGRPGCCVPEP